MKRYYIISTLCFVFAGVFFCINIIDSGVSAAILSGSIFVLLGIVSLFYNKLQAKIRPVLIGVGIIALVLSIYNDLSSIGINSIIAIVLTMVLVSGLIVYQKRFPSETRFWLNPVVYFFCAGFALTLFLLFSGRDEASSTKSVKI